MITDDEVGIDELFDVEELSGYEKELLRERLVAEYLLPDDTSLEFALKYQEEQLRFEASMSADAVNRNSLPEVLQVQSDGSEVVYDPVPTYQSLSQAEASVREALQSGEVLKMRIVRVICQIADFELYKQKGYATFRDYLPELKSITDALGWGNTRTVMQYLQLVRVYVNQLGFSDAQTMQSSTHLALLTRTANLAGRDSELREEDDGKKLGAERFGSLTRTVSGLVSASEELGSAEGEQVREYLSSKAVTAADIEVFEELAGADLYIPPGGWGVKETKALVNHILGKDEPKKKVRKVWEARRDENDGAIEVLNLIIELEDGDIIQAFEFSNKVMTPEDFELMTAGDLVVGLEEE